MGVAIVDSYLKSLMACSTLLVEHVPGSVS